MVTDVHLKPSSIQEMYLKTIICESLITIGAYIFFFFFFQLWKAMTNCCGFGCKFDKSLRFLKDASILDITISQDDWYE